MPTAENSVILFIINPISGGKTKTDWEPVIRQHFEAKGTKIEILNLTGNDDATSIKERLKLLKPAKAVAVGGDGTVTLVAKEVLGSDIALGIIPAGSANGMARELDIPIDIEKSLDVIAAGNTKKADVIDVNGHVCLHLSDIGLNAQLIKHFEEGKIRGKLGYASKVFKTLWTKSPMTVSVMAHGKKVVMKALMVVLANARMYGTGAVINPDGDLYDGRFEVVVMKRLAISELLKMWFKPQPFNPKKIRLFPATSVSIKTTKQVHFQVDGEYLGKVRDINANIIAGQLKIIIP